MRSQFTRLTGDVGNVEGLIQIQRLGKIRLGIKKKSAQSGNEFPSETEHFVCPPEVTAVYGDTPTQLDAMFPSDDENEIYQEKLAMYGTSQGLKCHGDGTKAERKNEQTGDWEPVKCPCPNLKSHENPKGQCSPQAHLKVILPKVSMWGYYQITTRSMYARGGILGAIDRMRSTLGRIAGIPIKLVRLPKEITPKGGKKKTHHILSFVPDLSLAQIMDLRKQPELTALPAYDVAPAVDENPQSDPVDEEVDYEAEDDPIDGHGHVDAEKIATMDQRQIDSLNEQLKQRNGVPKQPPKPDPKQEPVRNPVKTVPPEDWNTLILTVDDDPQLVTFKMEWKKQHQVDNVMKLNGAGQQSLLAHLREACQQVGRRCPV